MVVEIPSFFIKDKQAFDSSMRFLGKPIDMCKRLKKEGIKLVHIIDRDALKVMENNFDVYDHLTQFINIDIEIAPKEEWVIKLLTIKARVVIGLPCAADLKKFKEKKLVVGKIAPDFCDDVSMVHDLIIDCADDNCIIKFHKTGKRLIVYDSDYQKLETDNQKLIWGVLKHITL